MFQKIFTGFISTLLISAVAAAAPGAKPVDYVEAYVKKTETQSKSGKTKEEIRKEATESLRKAGFPKAELELVGAGKTREMPVERQAEILRALKADKTFQVRVGALESVRRADVARTVEKAITATRIDPKASVLERSLGKGDLAIISDLSSESAFGSRITEVLTRADEVMFPRLIEIAKNARKHIVVLEKNLRGTRRKLTNEKDPSEVAKLQARVEELETSIPRFKTNMVELMEYALQSKQIKGLEKDGFLGTAFEKACGDPAKGGLSLEAKDNFVAFVKEAAVQARDIESFVKIAGKAASEKFNDKAKEGEKRVCALAKAPCMFFSAPVQAFCAKNYP